MINITTLNQLSGILEGQELLNAYNKAENAEVSMEELDKALSPSPVKRVTKKKSRSGTMIQKDSLAMIIKTISKLKKIDDSMSYILVLDKIYETLEDLQRFVKEKV